MGRKVVEIRNGQNWDTSWVATIAARVQFTSRGWQVMKKRENQEAKTSKTAATHRPVTGRETTILAKPVRQQMGIKSFKRK